MKILGMGMPELLIILAVILLIFGPKNLPKLGASLGKTVKSLREGMAFDKKDDEEVEEIIERPRREGDDRPPMLDIHVNVYVERDSQKAIIIGRKGSRLKQIGTQARAHIEELLGRRVYLDLHVRTAKDWQSDPKMLGRLGF